MGLAVTHRGARVPEAAVRGKGSRGCGVGWLIAGLLGLAVLSGLVVFIRRRRSRPSADDTLVTDLLGPADRPAVPDLQAQRASTPSRAPQAAERGQPSPTAQAPEKDQTSTAPQAPEKGQTSPAPQARAQTEGEPSPSPAGGAGAEGDWLETQLAWINAWSQRMNQQITSVEQPEPHGKE